MCLQTSGPFGIDGASFPVTTYSFAKPEQGTLSLLICVDVCCVCCVGTLTERSRGSAGTWTAKIIIRGVENVPTDKPAVIAMITNKGGVKLSSYLNKYELEVGQEVGLIAIAHNEPKAHHAESYPTPLQLSGALETEMVVRFPDGRKVWQQNLCYHRPTMPRL